MGRHSAGGNSVNWTAVIAAVAVFGVGGAVAASTLTGGDDEPSAASSVTESHADHAGSGDASGGSDKRPSGESEDRADSCVAEVEAADELASAVARSAKSWREHSQAQVKLDAGEYTRKKTTQVWASSKARGPEDERRYDAASRAATASTGACDEDDDASTACTDRLEALDEVHSTGARVHKQWAAHLDMMAHKDHSEGAEYMQRWDRMVKAAGPALEDYDDAADELEAAPSCA